MSDQPDDYGRRLVEFATLPLQEPPPDLATLLAATPLPGVAEADNLLDLHRLVSTDADPAARLATLIDCAEYATDSGVHELSALLLALARASVKRVANDADQGSLIAAIENATAIIALQRGLPDLAEPLLERAEQEALTAGDEDMRAAVLLNRVNLARLNDKPDLAEETARQALLLSEARDDDFGRAQLLLTLADLAFAAGRQADLTSLVGRLEPLIGNLREPRLTAHLRALQGRIASDAGDFNLAERYYKAALLAARRAGTPNRIAAAEQDLAVVAQRSGRPGLARRRYVAALASAEEAQDASRLIVLHESLARVMHQLSRFSDAVQHARTAVEMGGRTALPGGPERLALLAATLLSIGESAEAQALLRQTIPSLKHDDLQMALSNLVSAFRVAKEDPRSIDPLVWQSLDRLSAAQQVEVLEDLAALWLESGAVSRAISVFADALELVDAPQRAWQTAMAASAIAGGPDPSAAEKFYRQALDVAHRQGQEQVAALVRGDLAILLGDMGRHDAALQQLRSTAAEAERLGDRELLQRVRQNESETLRRLGEYEEAVAAADTALDLAHALGDEQIIADAYVALGLALTSAGRDVEAESALRAALSIGDPTAHLRAAVSGALAGIAFRGGNRARALAQYRLAARLDRRPIHRAENLLGICVCYAAAGNGRSHDRNLQVLIDLVQAQHLERHIAPELTFVAREWMHRGETKAAGQVLGLSLVLALLGAARSSPSGPDFAESLTSSIAEPLLRIANFWNDEMSEETQDALESAMWRYVTRQVADESTVDLLRNWFREGRDVLRETDHG